MDRTADETLDLKASEVKACRMCLATDIKLYSLQDTHLGFCVKSIGGFNEFCVNLPNYVCYECAPILIKCDKLIEKSKNALSVLHDIFKNTGQINKHLIQEQTKCNPKLHSSLDCYLLTSYLHIQYDDDSSTSNFVNTESDPYSKIKLELKNEIKEELLGDDGLSSTKEENDSESDVETIEIPRPVVEISSDDEKMGDDFISLKSYEVRFNPNSVAGLLAYDDRVPRYHKLKSRKGIVAPKRGKRTKIKRFGVVDKPNQEDSFVRRYFNIKHMPTRTNKKFFCKSCPVTFQYMEEARDHIIIGCQRSTTHSAASPAIPPLESNTARPNQPNHWTEWPGGSK